MSSRIVAAVALLAIFVGCGSDRFASLERAQNEQLTLSANSSSLLAGTYVRNGIVLQFSVTPTTMELRDGGGAPLLRYRVNPDGSNTLDVLDQAEVVGWTDAAGEEHEMDTGDGDAATAALTARPEMQIAPYLSPALAANGASGLSNPLSMQLHALLAQLGSALGIDVAAGAYATPPPSMCGDLGADAGMDMSDGAGSSAPEPARVPTRAPTPKAEECEDISGDPNCDNCLGMCGPGCTCWRWVCGDCCWHRGCYWHDLHCRRCDRNHRRDCLLCALFDFGRPYFTC